MNERVRLPMQNREAEPKDLKSGESLPGRTCGELFLSRGFRPNEPAPSGPLGRLGRHHGARRPSRGLSGGPGPLLARCALLLMASARLACGATASGPLRAHTDGTPYFTDGAGRTIYLSGSHTWDSLQDTDQSASPSAFDFNAYVGFLVAHHHNVTVLWKKDLPTYCNWGSGGTWRISPFPWQRTGGASGTQMASDGLPAFDLTKFNQPYFDRLRARVLQLQQNNIYAIVQLFDGLGLISNRCANDGYPFSSGNNVNGVSDGGGTSSMTMNSPSPITDIQGAYVRKIIDTVNNLPNVLYEVSEEAPSNSMWWQDHMIALIRGYEAGKPFQHPIGYASLEVSGASDSTLSNSDADWVAPRAKVSPASSCGSGTPACKMNINDSEHSYDKMWNDSEQANRNFIWENFTNGAGVIFMDPYLILWTPENRNLCSNPVNGVCSAPAPRYEGFRRNVGYAVSYAERMNLAAMTPQGSLSTTGYCLANAAASGGEYFVYAPSGGTFSVDLSAATDTLYVEWMNPSTGAKTSGGSVSGGSSAQSFTPLFAGDAVLYLRSTAIAHLPPAPPKNLRRADTRR
jgi:hypothetical protein